LVFGKMDITAVLFQQFQSSNGYLRVKLIDVAGDE